MSLEYELQQEQVIHLDISQFVTVTAGTSVRDTVEKMRKAGHHSAMVTEGDKLAGIFTDRDLMRKVVNVSESWDQPIETVMTPDPITVNSNDPAYKALALMDEKHFRHVPVIDEKGHVIGNLTHHVIIKYLADRFPESVYNLPPDPDAVISNRDGA